MTTIDVHFHVVPFGFLEALRRDDLRAAVEVETLPDRDALVFHAPQGTAVEPNVSVWPHQYDASILLRAMDARRLDAAAVSPPPELFMYWANVDLGERIARTATFAASRATTFGTSSGSHSRPQSRPSD
jgi:hypothetical protein